MFAPNTYLIGAQKSGTTYLASLLDQHPDCCVCDPKEPQFFSKKGEAEAPAYAASFRNRDAKVTIDASTTYTFLRPFHAMQTDGAPGIMTPVPDLIKAAAPDAKFIYIMRDPVDRAISALKHHMRTGVKTPEQKRQLAETGSLSLVAELERDPMLELVGRYSDQIERYLAVFPRDRFLFLRFTDLTQTPEDVLAACAAFLELDPDPLKDVLSQGETHGAHELTSLGALVRTRPGLASTIKGILPKGLRRMIGDAVLRKPAAPITFRDREAAADRFAQDKVRVAELTGVVL